MARVRDFASGVGALLVVALAYGCTRTDAPETAAGSADVARAAEPASAAEDPQERERLELVARERDARLECEYRARRAREELAALGTHEWAGSYYRGDGLGINESLVLAPAGFAFSRSSCTEAAWNYGGVRAEDGAVRLTPELPLEEPRPCPTALVPVRVGERRYLVEEARLAKFESAAGRGTLGAPRHSAEFAVEELFFLNREDEGKLAAGAPVLPAGYRR
jgi:hypothetical protein